MREFLHVDDCADACVFLMQRYSAESHVNVGSGEDLSISDLARAVCAAVGYRGELAFDRSKPDGTPRKLMSAAKLRGLGWSPATSLEQGLADTYRWFLQRSGPAA
jgi:GDP-L-fucose synthase